ncbi:DUF3224 domain-containing protein [Bacillus sp. 41-22]|uniref:DUF3224 domain-containing protein n=1 Tax=Bacillus sp. 41-22 TaxID=2876713 RepID=UPI0021F18B9D|nr:DUF3224 domain-containing protein [Bacillus sp. 41-22]UYO21978.1 DUF3224 domain-containing protein [Bacillus sp. 41-22]
MEVTFTVSKWDEKPVNETRKDFPINIAHVEYDIDGELESLKGSYNYKFTGQTSKMILDFEF